MGTPANPADILKRTLTRVRTPEYPPLDLLRLEECSLSELIALLESRPGPKEALDTSTKEALIEQIVGEPCLVEDPVAEKRERIRQFVDAKRGTMSLAQVRCDLECVLCPRRMVVDCHYDNIDHLEQRQP